MDGLMGGWMEGSYRSNCLCMGQLIFLGDGICICCPRNCHRRRLYVVVVVVVDDVVVIAIVIAGQR